tara:strand:- start:2764 stop:3207 length:444 start_codon:yes stop_codon:yes gene_type:complete
MSIQDLEPYLDRVDLFLKGNGVPNQTILKEIRDIYDVTIKDKRLAKTSLGCGNCVTRMFNQIQGAANRGEIVKQGKHMKFPKLEQIDLEEQIAEEQTKAPIETLEIKTDIDIINYNRMAWGAFKKHCTSKGIKVKGKTKEQLLKELR